MNSGFKNLWSCLICIKWVGGNASTLFLATGVTGLHVLLYFHARKYGTIILAKVDRIHKKLWICFHFSSVPGRPVIGPKTCGFLWIRSNSCKIVTSCFVAWKWRTRNTWNLSCLALFELNSSPKIYCLGPWRSNVELSDVSGVWCPFLKKTYKCSELDC